MNRTEQAKKQWERDRAHAERLVGLAEGRKRVRNPGLARELVTENLLLAGYEYEGRAVYVKRYGKSHAPGARMRCVIRGLKMHRAVTNDYKPDWRRLSSVDLLEAANNILGWAHRQLVESEPGVVPDQWWQAGKLAHFFEGGASVPLCGGGPMRRETLAEKIHADPDLPRCKLCVRKRPEKSA